MSLSLKNQWLDAQNKVYIIFTVEEIMDALNCANQKATRLMVELEKQAGLIERKRQGLGRPNLIYFVWQQGSDPAPAQMQRAYSPSHQTNL